MTAPAALLKGFAKTLATAKPDPKKRRTLFDPETTGLAVRITPAGGRTFTVVARNPGGRQVWSMLGSVDDLTLAAARAKAKTAVDRIRAGLDPNPDPKPAAGAELVEAVFANFVRRYVEPAGLRSADEIRRIIAVHIEPAWKGRPFVAIRRGDVAKLLDDVEDGSGPVMADRVLAVIRKACNWHAARNEDYVSPVVKGMGRAKPKERQRARILSDDEIRAVWAACGQAGTFGAFVRVSLLTGQRRAKVAAMKRADIDGDGVWTIPTEAREKNNPGSLKLPPLARAIIADQPEVDGNPHVFIGRGKKHLNAFSQRRDELDKAVAAAAKKAGTKPPAPWVLHDLRRTARSLMSRAGVRSEIAERVLGHVQQGIIAVYDRHGYDDEKAEALKKLADLIALILKGPAAAKDNVVAIRRGKGRRS
jgi:integrase